MTAPKHPYVELHDIVSEMIESGLLGALSGTAAYKRLVDHLSGPCQAPALTQAVIELRGGCIVAIHGGADVESFDWDDVEDDAESAPDLIPYEACIRPEMALYEMLQRQRHNIPLDHFLSEEEAEQIGVEF